MKVCLICSHGGHLTEILQLIDAFEEHDVFFVTYESERTNNLKYKKYLFPNFGENPLELLKHLPKIISMIFKEKPDIIVSNGAEIAIPFFYLGKILRIKTIFIECYTRIDEPTISGKIVYPVSNLFLVLWPELLKKYGRKAQYWGDLFKIGRSKEVVQDEKEDMIFVIVGMHFQGFERLVKKMDEIAGKINEKVVMQIGNTQYEPKNAEFFKFKDYQEMKILMRKAKYVVCQGAMSAIDSLILGTPVIAIPRSKEQKEAINDHQLIFAKKLEEMGLIELKEDVDELENNLFSSSTSNVKDLIVNQDLITKLRTFLKNT